jgi:glycosyltransferase involved in cell wall biosynthesis
MTVDHNRFSIKLPKVDGYETPYLLFVGVMNDAKDGVNLLIEAFAQFVFINPLYKLYLVGPWNYDTPSHLARIKELNLTEHIFWKGAVARSIVPALLQTC